MLLLLYHGVVWLLIWVLQAVPSVSRNKFLRERLVKCTVANLAPYEEKKVGSFQRALPHHEGKIVNLVVNLTGPRRN